MVPTAEMAYLRMERERERNGKRERERERERETCARVCTDFILCAFVIILYMYS